MLGACLRASLRPGNRIQHVAEKSTDQQRQSREHPGRYSFEIGGAAEFQRPGFPADIDRVCSAKTRYFFYGAVSRRGIEKQVFRTCLTPIVKLVVNPGNGAVPQDRLHQVAGAKRCIDKAHQRSAPFIDRVDLCAIPIDGNVNEKTILFLLIDFLNQRYAP